jgi:hypothetical protein
MRHQFIAATCAILFATVAIGAARQPAKCAKCPAAEPAAPAAAASHPAEADIRGTKASPVTVDVVAVPGASEEEKRERVEERHERASTDLRLVLLTGAAALGTIGLAIATILLWRATRRLVLDAKENAERQLRAYLGVESSYINFPPGHPPEAGVTFKNYGNTPAYEFTINAGLGMAASFEELPPPFPEQIGEARGVLSPGAKAMLVRSAPVQVHPDHLTMLADGRLTAFVYGEVTYVDAFKKRRVLKYRLMTGGVVRISGNALDMCDKGNDAD